MAKMIPDQLMGDKKSPAERRLYRELRNQLPDDVVVFHHVPWQVRNFRAGARDGEADFVIVVPDQGVLVLEGKGGQIRYDGTSGQWFSNQYQIKNPFEQSKES